MMSSTEITIQIVQLLDLLKTSTIDLCSELPVKDNAFQIGSKRSSLYELYSNNRIILNKNKMIEVHFYLNHVYDMYLIHGIACLHYNSLNELCLSGLGTLSSKHVESLKVLNDFTLLYRDTYSISELTKFAKSVGFERTLCNFELHTLSSEDKINIQRYNVNSLNYIRNCYEFDCRFLKSLSQDYIHMNCDIDAVLDRHLISKNLPVSQSTSSKPIDRFLLEEDTSKAWSDNYAMTYKQSDDARALRVEYLALKIKQEALRLKHEEPPAIASKTGLHGAGGILFSFISLALTVLVSKKD